MQRTQIYLPENLRREIEEHRRARGESVAEYTRRALKERIEKEKKEKTDLKKLAEDFTSGVTKSGWEGIDILKWQREIRKDRKIFKNVLSN